MATTPPLKSSNHTLTRPTPPRQGGSASRVVAVLTLSLAAAAAAPAPTPNSFVPWTPPPSFNPAAWDAPPPAPPAAAAGLRYLVLPLPFGPSHSFVVKKVAATLAARGGVVLAVAPKMVAQHWDAPSDAGAASRWTALPVEGAGTVPGMMRQLAAQAWRERHVSLFFGPLAAANSRECDALLGNATAWATVTAFKPDFIVGDIMDPCPAVVSEVLRVPRADVAVGSYVHFMHRAPWRGSGRDWPVGGADPVNVPASNVAAARLPMPAATVARNLATRAFETVVDAITVRPVLRALHERHGVDLTTPAAAARAALLVVNADAAWEHARRLPASVLLPGSITAGPGEALPADLAAWAAAATRRGDRVVYCALGSLFKLPPADAAALAAGLAALPRVALLIKLGADELDDAAVAALPPSAKVVRWAPQNDVLASGAVSLFVGHGGANSVGEAVYHGVPLVVAPQGAEQVDNAVKAGAAGFAVPLLVRKPAPAAIVAAAAAALEGIDALTAAARVAQARARAGRPTGAAVAAAAIERAALLGMGGRVRLLEEVGGWRNVARDWGGLGLGVVAGVVLGRGWVRPRVDHQKEKEQ